MDGAKVSADDRRLVSSGGTRAGILHLTIPRRDSTVSVIAYNAEWRQRACHRCRWSGAGRAPTLS